MLIMKHIAIFITMCKIIHQLVLFPKSCFIYNRSDLAAPDQPFISEPYYESITKELKDILVKSCEQCCDRCAKVVHARSKVITIYASELPSE